jgi:hypothetical protein
MPPTCKPRLQPHTHTHTKATQAPIKESKRGVWSYGVSALTARGCDKLSAVVSGSNEFIYQPSLFT